MARKDKTDETGVDKAAEARAAIGTRPRQSPKRYVEYGAIVQTLAPERFDDLFGDNAGAVAGHINEVENPVEVFRKKSDEAQLALAIKALENDNALTGYAGYTFSEEAFAEKTRVKTPRSTKSKVEKATDLLSGASEEELAELAALLASRGVAVPSE